MKKIKVGIKKIVPKKILIWKNRKKKYKKYINSNAFEAIQEGEKRIILLGTPEYGNLGDHAIASVEKSFLDLYCPQHEVIEITHEMLFWIQEDLFSYIKEDDILLYTGGGFLGNLYDMVSLLRKLIISFPKNKIVIFPQTIFYTKDINGEKVFQKDREIFQTHPNVYVFLREYKSYKFMLENKMVDEEKIFCVPDIVLFHHPIVFHIKRQNIMICLRKDKEQCTEVDMDIIKNYAEDNNMKICFGTTRIDRDLITLKEREDALQQKFREFATYKLIITDRLHAMIFSAITGTPCIAIDNLTGKVSSVYEWIRDLEYVKFTNLDKFETTLNYMERCIIDKEHMYKSRRQEYKPLIKIMKEVTE